MLAEDKYSDTLDMESTSFISSATGTEEGTCVEIKKKKQFSLFNFAKSERVVTDSPHFQAPQY